MAAAGSRSGASGNLALFGDHDTLRSVKAEREVEPDGEHRARWGALRYRDFRFFWAARAISVAGDRISVLALPTVAILILSASPAQVGLLNGAGTLAWPGLGLFAGVWVDRLRRRRILVATDLLRAALLGSIPLAFALGHLSLLQLLLVAALVGGLTVFFDLASSAHVPALVPRSDWADANAKLEVAQQAVATGAPGLAGLLITLLSAPFAIAFDAVSFLASGLLISATDATDPAVPVNARRSLWSEAAEGILFLRRDRALVRITLCAAISNVGLLMSLALQLLFLYRVMHLSPVVVGACFALGSLASLVGALYNRRIMNRLGIHRTLVLSTFIEGTAYILIPVGTVLPVIPLLLGTLIVSGFFNTTWNVSVTTFRQTRIAPELMGRVGAAARVIGYGALPVGSLLGGLLGQELSARFGERTGLAIALVIAALVAGSSALALLGGRSFDEEGRPDLVR
ncbi:MAG: MFS transporter [Chloroflexi bacterium]|nr:MAG: MFS transporter [Chloroflexota bacterium]